MRANTRATTEADDMSARQNEEQQWIEEAAAGRRVAFDKLVERYHALVYRMAYRFCNNPDEALDATQEVFLRAWRGMRSFEGRSRFKTWLYRIAANTLISLQEEKRREQGSFLDYVSDWLTRPRTHDPEREVERNELMSVIGEKIARLPEEYRLALILRDVDGHRYDEIARILGIEEGTVKSRINRGRRMLQDMLSGYLGRS